MNLAARTTQPVHSMRVGASVTWSPLVRPRSGRERGGRGECAILPPWSRFMRRGWRIAPWKTEMANLSEPFIRRPVATTLLTLGMALAVAPLVLEATRRVDDWAEIRKFVPATF